MIKIIDELSKNDLNYLKTLIADDRWKKSDWEELRKRGGTNPIATKALVNAVNLHYESDTEELQEKEKKLKDAVSKISWWVQFRSGKISLIWLGILVLTVFVAIFLKLSFGQIQWFVTYVMPVASAGLRHGPGFGVASRT